jgi:hypothetical protein
MKNLMHWMAAPTALAIALVIAPSAYSNPVQTPLNSTVVVRGNSGGAQSNNSCRGFMFSATPNQVVRVTEPATSLTFAVQGSGQMALLITGPGSPICIPAEQGAGGISVPGVWQQGSYSVFVGDRANAGSAFTLSITQDN